MLPSLCVLRSTFYLTLFLKWGINENTEDEFDLDNSNPCFPQN